jgi:DNA-binding CsgD family transcriptional regulator
MTAVSLAVYDRLVSRIYEAALDPARWRVFVDDLSGSAAGATVGIVAHDHTDKLHLGAITTASPDHAASYDAYYSSIDGWISAYASMPVGTAEPLDSYVPRERLVQTEFYNDWLRPQGTATSAGIVLHRDEHRFIGLGIHIHGKAEEEETAPALQLIDRLAPHLLRSFDLARRISGQRIDPMLEDSLEAVDAGVFLVDRRGRLTRANSLGESLLRSGLAVTIGPDRRLALADPRAQQQVDRVLDALATGNHAHMSVTFTVRWDGATAPIQGSIVPFRPATGFDTPPLSVLTDDLPAAIIALSQPPAPAGLDALAGRFALSAAERRVAEALYSGNTLQSFAQERGISIHTARNQLKSLMSKAGVARQSQLVALFASLLSRAP